MLPKKQRLTKKEFSEVFGNGKKSSSEGFLLVTQDCVAGSEKVSVVCPKKVVSQAVKRNHLKKQVYSCLENNKIVWENSGKNLIVIVQKKPNNTPQNSFCSDLLELLKESIIVT